MNKQILTSPAMRFLAIAILLVLLIDGCTTKDGVLNALQQDTGSIRVTASESGADIFLNNVRRNQQTPAVLTNVPVGRQVIRVNKTGFRSLQDSIAVTVVADQEATAFFDMEAIVSGGTIQVSSDPDSALVLVNGIPQGDSLLTPTTLVSLDSGSYRIEIQKSGYQPIVLPTIEVQPGSFQIIDTSLTLQRQVLVEHFSSSTCIPCVEADSILEKILEERPVSDLISLGYHTEIPAPGDPMHNEARTGNKARVAFYNVTGNPLSYFDGTVPVGGVINLENRLNTAIDQQLSTTPKALVEIFDYQVDATSVSGRVRVEALEALNGYRLYIAAIETEINYASPPGVNGMTHFFDVFRGFTPDETGTEVNLAGGARRFVPFSFTANPIWDLSRLQVIAFLQQSGSSEVAQACWTLYPRL